MISSCSAAFAIPSSQIHSRRQTGYCMLTELRSFHLNRSTLQPRQCDATSIRLSPNRASIKWKKIVCREKITPMIDCRFSNTATDRHSAAMTNCQHDTSAKRRTTTWLPTWEASFGRSRIWFCADKLFCQFLYVRVDPVGLDEFIRMSANEADQFAGRIRQTPVFARHQIPMAFKRKAVHIK